MILYYAVNSMTIDTQAQTEATNTQTEHVYVSHKRLQIEEDRSRDLITVCQLSLKGPTSIVEDGDIQGSEQLLKPKYRTELDMWSEREDVIKRGYVLAQANNLQIRPMPVHCRRDSDSSTMDSGGTDSSPGLEQPATHEPGVPLLVHKAVSVNGDVVDAGYALVVQRSFSESGHGDHDGPVEGVFPSLPDKVLQDLGLQCRDKEEAGDSLTEQDIEHRFVTLSLAFKTDKMTLTTRYDLQQRQRDQAERNMAAEVQRLKAAIQNLNYLCKDSESVEILTRIKSQVDVLQQSTDRVSCSAEMYGAVQQENRVGNAVEVMLTHVENLKRLYEKEHTELEETKRVLVENNIVMEGNTDLLNESAAARTIRYRSLQSQSLVGISKMGSKRRASIATMPRPTVSDCVKAGNSSFTFGETKSRVIGTSARSRRPSLSPNPSSSASKGSPPPWDVLDKPDKPEGFNGMDDIKELAESRRESAVSEVPEQVDPLIEENNNCKVGVDLPPTPHRDSEELEDLGEPLLAMEVAGMPQDSGDELEPEEKLFLSPTRTPSRLAIICNGIADHTRQAVDTVTDVVWPVDLTVVRYLATGLLLLAAFWSIASTFLLTSAEPGQRNLDINWLSLEEILKPFVAVQRNGPRPA